MTFALRSRDSAIGENAKHPGLERGATLEVVESLKDRHPRLLNYLFGHRPRLYVDHCRALHSGGIPVNYPYESGLIATA